MAKFVIKCPDCDKFVEMNTGFDGFIAWFKGDKNKCSCGYKYNKEDNLSARKCVNCGNTVVYDQRKGESAQCPICKEAIYKKEDEFRYVSFKCPQCSCGLSTQKGNPNYNCPVCEYKIDVEKETKLADIANSGLASVIKYEGGNNTFVWKHPVEDFNIGSQLIVHESQEAIFFRNGRALDLFPAGRYTLETESIPHINKIYDSMLDPKGVFHSEVYYVNMATQMGIKWGTDSKVRFLEPITGIPLDIGASGEFNIRVVDSRKLLLKLVGTEGELDRSALMDSGTQQGFAGSSSGYFRAMIMTRVKTHLAKTIKENQINILEIDEHLDSLSAALRARINEGLDEYGLTMPEFFVTNLVTPDDDANFKKLKQQHADLYLRVQDEKNLKSVREAEAERRVVETRTGAQLNIIEAQGGAEVTKITAAAEAEAYRLKAEAEAKEMQMKGYTYTQETQRQIGLEAMQGGIVKEGGGAGSGLGDIIGLGFTLGAVGGVVELTKDALTPITENLSDAGKTAGTIVNPSSDSWDCSCGEKNITKNFCSNCGAKRPEPPKPWICSKCGEKNDKGNFCSICVEKKPVNTIWDCICGEKDITKNFCSNCGKKREEVQNG